MPTQTELTRRDSCFSYPLEDWPLAESYDVGPLVLREVRHSTPSRGISAAIAPTQGNCEHLCEQLAHINQSLHRIAAGLQPLTPERRVSVKPRNTSGCSVYHSAPVCILMSLKATSSETSETSETPLKATSNETSETPVAADPSGSVSQSVVSRGLAPALGTPSAKITPPHTTTSCVAANETPHQKSRPAGQSTFLVVHKSHIHAKKQAVGMSEA